MTGALFGFCYHCWRSHFLLGTALPRRSCSGAQARSQDAHRTVPDAVRVPPWDPLLSPRFALSYLRAGLLLLSSGRQASRQPPTASPVGAVPCLWSASLGCCLLLVPLWHPHCRRTQGPADRCCPSVCLSVRRAPSCHISIGSSSPLTQGRCSLSSPLAPNQHRAVLTPFTLSSADRPPGSWEDTSWRQGRAPLLLPARPTSLLPLHTCRLQPCRGSLGTALPSASQPFSTRHSRQVGSRRPPAGMRKPEHTQHWEGEEGPSWQGMPEGRGWGAAPCPPRCSAWLQAFLALRAPAGVESC